MPDLGALPKALRDAARWERFGNGSIPVLLARPTEAAESRVPALVWMHGRTADKELDPGRYLRLIRSGIGVCAIDLPGHGERADSHRQTAEETLPVIEQMAGEIDAVVVDLERVGGFDVDRLALGGMSAGGMATMVRLCRPHRFVCACLEATTGSWRWQRGRGMHRDDFVQRLNPIDHLSAWRDIPLLALHAIHDEWVNIEGQREFIEALRRRSARPETIELIEFDRTGAPFEHAGFGRLGAQAKDIQVEFLKRWLLAESDALPS